MPLFDFLICINYNFKKFLYVKETLPKCALSGKLIKEVFSGENIGTYLFDLTSYFTYRRGNLRPRVVKWFALGYTFGQQNLYTNIFRYGL